MKTLKQILEYKSTTIDSRDLYRLGSFIPEDKLTLVGLAMSAGTEGSHTPEEFTKENVLKHLEEDVKFGFKKALDKRGLSSSMMNDVIKMWNWILEEGLEDFSDDNYAQYGLPLLKATALKYGFDNPIGDDVGDEEDYT